MNIAIVGSEAAKFTSETEEKARNAIYDLLAPGDIVISGRCHLGGIDIWAAEIGRQLGLGVIEYPPEVLNWKDGYKPRNLRIVEASDKVVCITLRRLPSHFHGMRFPYCYHCNTDSHIKSGGCWTMKEAAKRGKDTQLIVIE